MVIARAAHASRITT